jgi:hypothetical protein
MLDGVIPVKTAAGRAEVGDRRHKLGPRQRMVLISINGELSVGAIRQQFRSLSELDSVLEELLDAGLIEIPGASEATLNASIAQSAEPQAPVTESNAPPQANVALQAAREFMNKTIVSKLGLRAFMFTLRIEKCHSKQELLDLLPEFRRVLRKSVDAAGVSDLSARAEELINAG